MILFMEGMHYAILCMRANAEQYDDDVWQLLLRRTMLTGLFGWLLTRVRRLHLSTHSRDIHWSFMKSLEREGWEVQAHYPTLLPSCITSCNTRSMHNSEWLLVLVRELSRVEV